MKGVCYSQLSFCRALVAMTTDNNEIPSSFSTSVDRPFDPIGVRDVFEEVPGRVNERLTDAQIRDMINNPPPQADGEARLRTATERENQRREAEQDEQRVYNMSVKQLASRTAQTVFDILDDTVNFEWRDGPRGVLRIFTSGDRLMYIGILLGLAVVAAVALRNLFTTNPPVLEGGGGAHCCFCKLHAPHVSR